MSGLMFWIGLALTFPVLAVASLVMAMLAREKVRALDERLGLLEKQVGSLGRGAAPSPSPAPAAPPRTEAPAVEIPAPVPLPPAPREIFTSAALPTPAPREPFLPPLPSIDWENFTAARLFSWIGGVALFFGAAFLVKYSMDHGWITPAMRVAAGLLIGGGALAAGVYWKSEEAAVTRHTLAASGVAVLYADVFAARSLYGFIPPAAAFFLMVLITVIGFLTAVRLNSRYVALLGLVGGFLTPVLISTGTGNPVALFSYVALLDLGLAAVVLRQGWGFLWGMAAGGTLFLSAGWSMKYFSAQNLPAAAVAFSFFPTLFQGVLEAARRREKDDLWILRPAGAVAGGTLLLCLSMATLPASSGAWFFLPLLLVTAGTGWQAVRRDDPETETIHGGATALSFVALCVWMDGRASADNLPAALAALLVFCVIHAAVAVAVHRRRPGSPWAVWGPLVPALFLVPILFGNVLGAAPAGLLWPAAFLINAAVLVAAWLVGRVLAVLAAFALTLLLGYLWVTERVVGGGEGGLVAGILLFAAATVGLCFFLSRARPAEAPKEGDSFAGLSADMLPAVAGLLPFLLLVVAAGRLRPSDPSMLFGGGLLLAGFSGFLGAKRGANPLTAAAAVGLGLLQAAWLSQGTWSGNPLTAVLWGLGTWAFVCAPALAEGWPAAARRTAWMTAAAAGPVAFFLLYKPVRDMLGADLMGLWPLVLAADYGILLYTAVRRGFLSLPGLSGVVPAMAGVTLLFISAVFPVQLEKQWITVGWALEAVALLFLYRRLSHGGLKAWAGALLALVFVRLTFNPWVWEYHARSAVPIFNWYLYTYGAAVAAFWGAAVLWSPADEAFLQKKIRPALWASGGVLLFLLVNIEVADFFSEGSALTWRFSASLAQDVATTLAWGLFAAACLGVGLAKDVGGARKAGTALMLVTAAKLFLHDLWRLGQLYRVGAFIGMAVVMIVVSFFYQRFAAKKEKS